MESAYLQSVLANAAYIVWLFPHVRYRVHALPGDGPAALALKLL